MSLNIRYVNASSKSFVIAIYRMVITAKKSAQTFGIYPDPIDILNETFKRPLYEVKCLTYRYHSPSRWKGLILSPFVNSDVHSVGHSGCPTDSRAHTRQVTMEARSGPGAYTSLALINWI
jgi:hypothetical protein